MSNAIKAYAGFFKGWPTKIAGPKPSAAQLDVAAQLGARVPSKVGLALAMYQRPQGATQGQVIAACGGPQLNKLRGLITAGKVSRVSMPNDAAGHTVYKMVLKGRKTPAKAHKAKAKGKAKAKAVTPASDAPSVTT